MTSLTTLLLLLSLSLLILLLIIIEWADRWTEASRCSGLCYCREFKKGGLVKGGLAIYAFPLCNCNTLDSVF